MKFFVPQVGRSKYQETYDDIVKSVKDQMRIPITERKIFRIKYVHDKKPKSAEVGKVDPHQGRYEILAILESKPHVIFTRSPNGSNGLTILVSNDEITEIEDFD